MNVKNRQKKKMKKQKKKCGDQRVSDVSNEKSMRITQFM